MKIIKYNFQKKYLNQFYSLIGRIYDKKIAEQKIFEAKKLLDPQNPFFKYGTCKNILIFDNDVAVGHVSFISDHRLKNMNFFGFFESADLNSAQSLINIIKEHVNKNKKDIFGPVNLTTWQNFRFCLENENPPFLGEPFNKSFYSKIFLKNGFIAIQENISFVESLNKNIFKDFEQKYLNCIREFKIIKVNSRNLSQAKKIIFTLAKKVFYTSQLFVKISFAEFLYIYKEIFQNINEHFIYYVTYKNKPVAFFLNLSNMDGKKTIIAKTLGVLPNFQRRGIGTSLFYQLATDVLKLKYKEIIFSTLRVGNDPIQALLSTHKLKRYRNYQLLGLNK